MGKTTIKVELSDSMKKNLLKATQDIQDEDAKNIIMSIIEETEIIKVEIDEKDLGPVVKGPAQHIAHQINN